MYFVLFRSECFRQDKSAKPMLGIPGNLNNGSQRKNKTTIYEFSIKLVSSKSLLQFSLTFLIKRQTIYFGCNNEDFLVQSSLRVVCNPTIPKIFSRRFFIAKYTVSLW